MAIWNILRTFGIFYDHLVQFVFIGTFFPVLVSCTEKNLATLGAQRPPKKFPTLILFVFCANFNRDVLDLRLISNCMYLKGAYREFLNTFVAATTLQ
jgi:hypothetical protein